jgi:hypothetical protein
MPRQRERDGESAPLAGREPERSAVPLDDLLAEREPQPVPSLLRREERQERLLLHFGAHTEPRSDTVSRAPPCGIDSIETWVVATAPPDSRAFLTRLITACSICAASNHPSPCGAGANATLG